MQAPMSDALVALDQVPRAHEIAFPAEHQKPCGHGSQPSLLPRPSSRPTVPSSHGVGADAPSAHHDRTRHTLHAVIPDSSCQLPAAQRRHAAMLELGAKEPGGHGAGSAAPVVQA